MNDWPENQRRIYGRNVEAWLLFLDEVPGSFLSEGLIEEFQSALAHVALLFETV